MDIIKSGVDKISTGRRDIKLKKIEKPIKYESLLVAWGANKVKLPYNFDNIHYIEDQHSHAKAHNALIKAKSVLIVGNVFEVVQTAQAARDYMDSLGLYDTKITVMTLKDNEITDSIGPGAEMVFQQLLKRSRITFLPQVSLTEFEGETGVQTVHFNVKGEYGENVDYDQAVDSFINVDMVIADLGVGRPKSNLLSIMGAQSQGSSHAVSLGSDG